MVNEILFYGGASLSIIFFVISILLFFKYKMVHVVKYMFNIKNKKIVNEPIKELKTKEKNNNDTKGAVLKSSNELLKSKEIVLDGSSTELLDLTKDSSTEILDNDATTLLDDNGTELLDISNEDLTKEATELLENDGTSLLEKKSERYLSKKRNFKRGDIDE
jgi:hypothetical protein